MATKEKSPLRLGARLAPLLVLLAAVVAPNVALANSLSAPQTRAMQNPLAAGYPRQAESPQVLILQQENAGSWGYDASESCLAPMNAARTGAVQAYEVGTADALRARSLVGDAIDIHHVGQAAPMEQMIPGYLRSTGPSIALPEVEHGLIPTLRGTTNLTPRQLLGRDIWNLRNYTNAPNSSLQELIELNKQMYPGAFAK